jgi:hypothetical protein
MFGKERWGRWSYTQAELNDMARAKFLSSIRTRQNGHRY